jgi:3'-phosphoadenosine 5'-phosphosulfate sulfotransferase (PAPS reductase)/FAD synthetase
MLNHSQEIYELAVERFNPKINILMFSGGNDSLTALHVAKTLNIKINYVLHINTETGISETTQFCRSLQDQFPYQEVSAGTSYQDYVLRKGFFGRGSTAHTNAYHILKATHYRKFVSSIRQRRRNFKVLLLNGARLQESKNRKHNLKEIFNIDPAAKSNVWVNLIHDWSKIDCLDFLQDNKVKLNQVTQLIHRSGECMCGTMQSLEDRKEASLWFPDWGNWLDDLEKQVICKHPWKWGYNIPPWVSQIKNGQLPLSDNFSPMCQSCQFFSK